MTHTPRKWMAQAAAIAACAAAVVSCESKSPTTPGSRFVVSAGTDGNFRSVADALRTAPAGEVIEVRGVISERVVIATPGIKLRGTANAAIDGAPIDGRGTGILIKAPGVEVSGLTVRNFEIGITVDKVADVVIQGNDIHANNNKTANTAPPLVGTDAFNGVVLEGATNARIIDNVLRDNGHDGLTLQGGSRNNIVRNNRVLNNGAQTAPSRFGCGINLFSGTENSGNQITDNEVNGNHWGILFNNFAGNTGNLIRNNRVRGNGRAGIAALVNAGGNTIQDNDARDNATFNIAPSLSFDLFDAPPLNNVWQNNQGRFNFAAGSTLTAGQIAAVFSEAFGPDGCMRGSGQAMAPARTY